jgi:hypothetical protein
MNTFIVRKKLKKKYKDLSSFIVYEKEKWIRITLKGETTLIINEVGLNELDIYFK